MRSFLFCLGALSATLWAGQSADQILLPKPSQVQTQSGLDWTSNLGLSPQYGSGTQIATALTQSILAESGLGKGIPFALELNLPLDSGGEEGYLLKISESQWTLRAHTQLGLLYGLQSVRLLLHSGASLSQQTILDQPSLTWRGLMLDLARNMMPLSYVRSTIDRMAMLKLNRLHLHLSDDQGYRLESKKYPLLTTIGSQSSTLNSPGFMTQDEYVALQDYAIAHGVVIVPEIDVPGHTHAIKASYPHLGCGTDVGWPYTGTNVGFSKLCLAKDSSKIFTREIFAELAPLTKGPWIHMGGDEISDPNYKTYVSYADSVITALGKYAIGWEEIASSTLQAQSSFQKWKSSFKTTLPNTWVNSDCSYTYFDHPETKGGAGLTWCGAVLADTTVYKTPAGSLGIEGALWGELVGDTLTSKDRLFPRTFALAEAAWTPSSKRSTSSYKARFPNLPLDGISAGLDFNADLTPIHTDPPFQLQGHQLWVSSTGGSAFLYNAQGQLLWSQNLNSLSLSLPRELQGRFLLSIYNPGQRPQRHWIHLH